MDKAKILQAINDGDFGCRKDSVVKLMEAVIGEKFEREQEFPCLMRYSDGDFLIAIDASSQYSGLLIKHGGGYKIGSDFSNIMGVKPYTGKLTLENVDGKLKVTEE